MSTRRWIRLAFFLSGFMRGLNVVISLWMASRVTQSNMAVIALSFSALCFIIVFISLAFLESISYARKAAELMETQKDLFKTRINLTQLNNELLHLQTELTKARIEAINREVEFTQRLKEQNLLAITELLRAIRANVGLGFKRSRTCLFLYNEENDELYIYHSSGGLEDEEKTLRFRKNQGVVGKVFWTTGEPTRVNMDGIMSAQLRREWEMTEEQIRQTSELKSILAVPILRLENENQMIGVLSIDSREPLQTSGLTELENVNKAMDFANQLVKFIDTSSYSTKTKPKMNAL